MKAQGGKSLPVLCLEGLICKTNRTSPDISDEKIKCKPLCKILAQREHSIHIVVHQDYLEERAVPHHNSDQALETYCKTSYIEIVLLTYCFCTNTSSRSKKDGGLRNVTAFFT